MMKPPILFACFVDHNLSPFSLVGSMCLGIPLETGRLHLGEGGTVYLGEDRDGAGNIVVD